MPVEISDGGVLLTTEPDQAFVYTELADDGTARRVTLEVVKATRGQVQNHYGIVAARRR